MAKRRRCLLGLGALFVSQRISVEGFLVPSSPKVQFRNNESLEKLFWRHDNKGAVPASTCPLFAQAGRKKTSDGQQSDAEPEDEGSLTNMPLSLLLEELDNRDIRYPPFATRSDLENLLRRNTRPLHGQTTTVSSSPSSLQELLEELDRRGIRYPPTASRMQLEALLRRANERHELNNGPQETVVTFESISSTQRRPIQDDSPSTSDYRLPLNVLLTELDRLDIRYSPTASRRELEELLKKESSGEGGWHEKRRQRRQEARETHTRSSTSGILEEETIYTVETDSSERKSGGQQLSATRTFDSYVPSSAPRMPLNTLLAELDKLNIRYSPTASRIELDDLLKQSLEQQRLHEERRQRRRREREAQNETSSSNIKDLFKKSTRVASKSVQKLPKVVSKIATSPQVTSRISGVAESAARQAKRVSSRASDFWNTDEDGIRDVPFEYVSVDRPIDVRAVRLDDDETQRRVSPPPRYSSSTPRRPAQSYSPHPPVSRRNGTSYRARRSRRSTSRSTASWYSDEGVPPRQRRPRPARRSGVQPVADWQPYSRTPKRQRQRRSISRQKVDSSLGSSSFLLPPASKNSIPFPNNATSTAQNVGNNDVAAATKGHRWQRDASRNGSNGKKRVYSHYVYDEDGEIEGPFDQIGEFLTNSVDRLLWGPDESDSGNRPEKQQRKQSRSDEARKQDSSGKAPRKGRYWKDRLAEQVDYALGIHEDGDYYNSWEKQLDEEQRRRDREGPEPWEQVSRPKTRRRRPLQKGRIKYRDPLWEKDGSMFSLLLGRPKRGSQLEVEVRANRYQIIRSRKGDLILLALLCLSRPTETNGSCKRRQSNGDYICHLCASVASPCVDLCVSLGQCERNNTPTGRCNRHCCFVSFCPTQVSPSDSCGGIARSANGWGASSRLRVR